MPGSGTLVTPSTRDVGDDDGGVEAGFAITVEVGPVIGGAPPAVTPGGWEEMKTGERDRRRRGHVLGRAVSIHQG